MIAAGVNAKTLSLYMCHSSIVMTMDRYGHLFTGNEKDSAEKLVPEAMGLSRRFIPRWN